MMKREKIEIKMTSCPECDANMTIPNDAVEGEIVTCPDCGASYELVKASDGFELKPAQTVGEDWGQ
jgi:alpha-aminoadipate carrier protein LysW